MSLCLLLGSHVATKTEDIVIFVTATAGLCIVDGL